MKPTLLHWLVLVTAACANGSSSAAPEEPLPGRDGVTGDAGAPGPAGEAGPPGPKGDTGFVDVTEAFGNKPGPLPASGTFTSTGGKLVVTVSGTAYRTTTGTIGYDVAIDTNPIGSVNAFTNEPNSHKALPVRTFVVTGIAAGSHTIDFAAQANTVSDGNDYFNATVLEVR